MATFNPAVPLSSDSPSIFPPQNQGNMGRLQTVFAADHQFNLTAAANDGYHNLIHKTLQAPAGALASTGRSYVKTSGGRVHDFYMDDTGQEYQVTPTMPIRAAVNFNGTGANGNQVLRSQYNVASVNKTATGKYTITFTTAMPNDGYIVQLTGMRNQASKVSNGMIAGDGTYTNSVKVGSLKVEFVNDEDEYNDVLMGNLVIMSVT